MVEMVTCRKASSQIQTAYWPNYESTHPEIFDEMRCTRLGRFDRWGTQDHKPTFRCVLLVSLVKVCQSDMRQAVPVAVALDAPLASRPLAKVSPVGGPLPGRGGTGDAAVAAGRRRPVRCAARGLATVSLAVPRGAAPVLVIFRGALAIFLAKTVVLAKLARARLPARVVAVSLMASACGCACGRHRAAQNYYQVKTPELSTQLLILFILVFQSVKYIPVLVHNLKKRFQVSGQITLKMVLKTW